jgi:hypothetical protein
MNLWRTALTAAEPVPATEATPFFVADGDALIPQPISRGPWGETMHGRVFGALAAREVERYRANDPDLICARLTVDIFKPGLMTPVWMSTRAIREGRRIAVLEVTIEQEGGPIGQGKAMLLRATDQPTGQRMPTPEWGVPTPLELGAGTDDRGAVTRLWESWPIAPRGEREFRMRDGLWMREIHDLVGGEALTPLTRLGAAGDVAHPVGNSSTTGLEFINPDYTIYMGREPRGEYIGIQPYGHISALGIGVAQCIAHDLDGPFGFIAAAALANSMTRANDGARPR